MSQPWQVELVGIGSVVPSLLRTLREDLAGILVRPVWISTSHIDPMPFFDPRRGQYAAHSILERLLQPPPKENVQRIGITELDLFLPVFTHVFGAAQLGGPVGLASLYRLRPEFEGSLPDLDRTHERLLKEVLHELGHTLALIHCRIPWCAMGASRLPGHVDLKDSAFCNPCADRIGVPINGLQLFDENP
ncbi:MAG: hypothetical protein K8R59_14305 [Thermoanaerobaculales bacterium]|nr:hypothetical protein [Thermoanaerobaculales bacterium]